MTRPKALNYFFSVGDFFHNVGNEFTEAATGGVLWKKVFLEISQNSQENTCARASFLINLEASGTGVFLWILRNF